MNKGNTLLNINMAIISLVIVFYILYIGDSFIIPFVIAFLLAFSLISTYTFFIKIIKYKFLAFVLNIMLYSIIFWVMYKIINSNIQDIVSKAGFYQDQFRFLIDKSVARFGLEEGEFYQKLWSYINFQDIFTNMATLVTNMLGYIGTTLFYLIFILLEYKFFNKKVTLMVENEEKRRKVFEIINKIKKDIKTYFTIKIFISFCSATMYYIVMRTIGLDFAMFWAFLIFILNFIPNIGSIIAIFFPMVLSLIQFDNFSYFFVMVATFVSIEMVMGNIVEPKLTGNKLNLSPLVILLSLVFWGSIWGIVGMLLSVPIMVIINIILSKFDETKPIAILLSEKGDVKSGVDLEFTKNKIKLMQKIEEMLAKKSVNK
ncbi:AI-2E family transporter [Candidatus Gracilibacteria bacterium]|nr:AI-2E family transporter [Candidatus Gracilibacteria bacterium]